jgi:hypothetical protein
VTALSNISLSPRSSSDILDIRFQLSGDVSFLKIGGKKAVFSEHLQKVFELNDTAAYIASVIADRPSMADLLLKLEKQGLPTSQALETIRGFVTAWSRAKLLSASVSTDNMRPYRRDMIAIAGHNVAIRYHDAALADRISPAFAHLKTLTQRKPDLFDVVARDSLVYVVQHNKPALVVEPNQAAPALKGMLTDALFAGARFTLALHCAMLVYRGQALLITGPPGAGKTTLTLALLNRGFEYGGDDITLLMNDERVRGVSYAPALKPGAWKLSHQLALHLSGTQIHKRLDGKRVRYVPPLKLAPQTPVHVKWIATLRRGVSGGAELQPANVATILKDLIEGAHTHNQKLDDGQLRLLINMISQTMPDILHYSNASQAAQILEQKCESN